MAWEIVIAGGGFGGFSTARVLERMLPAQSARVTLVNETNFMLYTPLLPGAAGATLDPRHVVVPLRSQLRETDLLIGSVTGLDPATSTLAVRRVDGEEVRLGYDHLVVALGSISRTLPIPGLAEHAIGLKSLADATALRNRVLGCLDIAESLEHPVARAQYLSFVFVGAGYAGVEGLAELQDFAVEVIDLYPRCRAQGMSWTLIEARDRILPEVPPELSRFAAGELIGRGIDVRAGTTIREISDAAVTLTDGESITARTVVWTAGVRPAPVVSALNLPLDAGGRIVVDSRMAVNDHPGVWAIGDCAAVPDPARPGQPCPPTAQHAIRQGRRVARNVAATVGHRGRVRPFRYRTKGVVAELGHNQAVAITLGIRWRGFPAWIVARTYHLMLMPGVGRKFRLMIDWNVALMFGRDASAPGALGSATPLEHIVAQSEQPPDTV